VVEAVLDGVGFLQKRQQSILGTRQTSAYL
jgi:hypothetical protein